MDLSTPSILIDIVQAKSLELETQKSTVSINQLQHLISIQPPAIDFKNALSGSDVSLIAEIKKASPSKGLLCPDFDPVQLAEKYAINGAAAISVLTDPRFQGELEHIVAIKNSGASRNLPILRKDFIFDDYQVYEARANKADAILLIAAILEEAQLKDLKQLSYSLGMHTLIEIHNESELEMVLKVNPEIIGINNRDLRTFTTDIKVTEDLARLIPPEKLIISESGISSREHIDTVSKFGVRAVLVGEALVTSKDIANAVRILTKKPDHDDLTR